MDLNDIRKRTDWSQMTKEAWALLVTLARKPKNQRRRLQRPGPRGILCAYRRGDLSYEDAVRALEEWKDIEIQISKNNIGKSLLDDGIVIRASHADFRHMMGG